MHADEARELADKRDPIESIFRSVYGRIKGQAESGCTMTSIAHLLKDCDEDQVAKVATNLENNGYKVECFHLVDQLIFNVIW